MKNLEYPPKLSDDEARRYLIRLLEQLNNTLSDMESRLKKLETKSEKDAETLPKQIEEIRANMDLVRDRTQEWLFDLDPVITNGNRIPMLEWKT